MIDDEHCMIADFKKSLFNPLSSTLEDVSELALDSLFEDDILSEIPIIKSVIAIIRVGFNIRDRYFVKKLTHFIISVNNQTADKNIIEKRKQSIASNPKKLKRDLDTILILIDRYLEIEKAKYLANAYILYLDGKIDWSAFLEISALLDRLILNDVDELKQLYDKYIYDESKNFSEKDYPHGYGFYPKGCISYNEIQNKVAFSRLQSLGLVERLIPQQPSGLVFADNNYIIRDCKINSLGIQLYELIISR